MRARAASLGIHQVLPINDRLCGSVDGFGSAGNTHGWNQPGNFAGTLSGGLRRGTNVRRDGDHQREQYSQGRMHTGTLSSSGTLLSKNTDSCAIYRCYWRASTVSIGNPERLAQSLHSCLGTRYSASPVLVHAVTLCHLSCRPLFRADETARRPCRRAGSRPRLKLLRPPKKYVSRSCVGRVDEACSLQIATSRSHPETCSSTGHGIRNPVGAEQVRNRPDSSRNTVTVS